MVKKTRILCLHGGASNNDITAFQTMGLKLGSRMECIYLNAPHLSRCCYPGLDRLSDGPWYIWSDISKGLEHQEDQWDESLEHLAKYCKENGPFDGVYGFSQGTAIITDFSHPNIWKDKFKMKSCPWKFAILACGGASHQVTLKRGMTVKIPSFHIWGKKDRILNDSKTIAEYWDPPMRITHSHGRGHEIDVQMCHREGEMMEKLSKFLDDHLDSNKGLIESVRKTISDISMPEMYLFGRSFGGKLSD